MLCIGDFGHRTNVTLANFAILDKIPRRWKIYNWNMQIPRESDWIMSDAAIYSKVHVQINAGEKLCEPARFEYVSK